MEEEEGYGSNDDAPLEKPSRKPRRGLGVAELERLISEQEKPLSREDHNNSIGRASPDTVVTPLLSASNMNESITQNSPVSSFSDVCNPGHSILCKNYLLPPQQFPIVSYQQEMPMNTQEHSTMYPSPLMIPLPAITQAPSSEKHGAKRLPPRLVDETDETEPKRRRHIPNSPNWPPTLRSNPSAHPIGRGLQPASTDAGGRFRAPGNVAFRALDSSAASIPSRVSSNIQKERSNPGGRFREIAPPANHGTLEQRLTPGGESLTLAPPGNVGSKLILKPRQPPDTETHDSGTTRFQDLRSSSGISLPFHNVYTRGPAMTSQQNTLDSSEEYDPDVDVELRIWRVD